MRWGWRCVGIGGCIGLILTLTSPHAAIPVSPESPVPADTQWLLADSPSIVGEVAAKRSTSPTTPPSTPTTTPLLQRTESTVQALERTWVDSRARLDPLTPIDRAVVYKAKRRLELLRDQLVVKSFPIKLGLKPVGAKEFEGDTKTPEGVYALDWRSASSRFFLAIHVTYPNDRDRLRAQKAHRSAGSAIMIHGLPSPLKYPLDYYQKNDWTDGCIALSNEDMVEVWMLTPPNTPIEIKP